MVRFTVEEVHTGAKEREILTGMIMNPDVIAAAARLWEEGGSFSSRYANIVGGWCISNYGETKTALGRGVMSCFVDWQLHTRDEETGKILDSFLSQLQDEYDGMDWRSNGEINSLQVISSMRKYFEFVAVEKLEEALRGHRQRGHVDQAISLIQDFQRRQLATAEDADLFNDSGCSQLVFSQERVKPLVRYQGALGEFFGDQLAQDCFVSFVGPEGCGKSWWLMDIAYRALMDRKKVAHFDMGDMSREQVMERYIIRTCQKPLRSDDGKWPVTVRYPTSFSVLPDGAPDVEGDEMEFSEPLTQQEWEQARLSLIRRKLKSNRTYFRVSNFPNSTGSVPMIEERIRSWELENFRPEVVIVDYADIIAPISKRFDKRDQINETWQALRSLSQKLHLLIVTATQSNRESYGKKWIRMEHMGEDKRKLAHVNSMFGINVSEAERERGVFRLNQPKRRTGGHHPRRAVYTVGCLPLSNPAVLSAFRPKEGESHE